MTREELWLQERPRLEKKLRTRMSRADAQDIVDEAFARLGDTAEAGQLWQTALNVEREHLRRRLRADLAEEQAGILNGRAIPNIETAILRADFDRALRRLPREQLEAFALVELRGLTEREASAVLGVPQSTVNWRCEAARTFLREELT